MVRKSRAGTILLRRQDGASQKKRGTIFEAKPKSTEQKRTNGSSRDKPKPVLADEIPENKVGTTAPAIELTQPSRTLEEISQTSARVIYQIKTIFPFVLFPDEIIVDEEKVSIIIGNFYQSGYLRSVMIKDISNVSINTSMFFSSCTIVDRNYVEDELVIRFLRRNEAFKMRRILMGLIISDENKVDLSAYSIKDLRKYLEKIGASRTDDSYNL